MGFQSIVQSSSFTSALTSPASSLSNSLDDLKLDRGPSVTAGEIHASVEMTCVENWCGRTIHAETRDQTRHVHDAEVP